MDRLELRKYLSLGALAIVAAVKLYSVAESSLNETIYNQLIKEADEATRSSSTKHLSRGIFIEVPTSDIFGARNITIPEDPYYYFGEGKDKVRIPKW